MPNFNGRGISLSVQLYALVIFLTVVSFTVRLLMNVDHTRDYLNDQMASHSQDAATSLGLSISPYMDDENLVIADTMMSAIFDSGYYQSMRFVTQEGQVKLNRENPQTVESVPAWFMHAFELTPPTGSSEVNDGWQIAGTLYVTSHPGVSYLQLWQYAQRAFLSSLVILIVSLIIAHFILRAVLKPLHTVTEQADAVSRKQFVHNPATYWTKEVNVLAGAINAMVVNVQKTFDSMTKHAENLTRDAYLDKLTALGNRRAFESQFKLDLHDLAEHHQANTSSHTIGLVSLASLQSVNRDFGYQAGDAYVLEAVEILKNSFKNISGNKIYRIAGGSFIFTLPHNLELCLDQVQLVHESLQSLSSSRYPNGFGSVVVTGYSEQDTLTELLARLDTLATTDAANLGQGVSATSFQAGSEQTTPSLGLQQWKQLISDILATGEVEFSYQPVKAANSTAIIYNELFARFSYQNDLIANAPLFAMAERLDLTEELDKKIIMALGELSKNGLDKPVAVNISRQSLHSAHFSTWLSQFMRDAKPYMTELYFEVNETALLDNINGATNNINLFKTHGIKLCIERFGVSFSSFKYLRGLNVDFIKLDGSYVRDLMQNPDNNYFIQAVTQICHGLGIKVIACHVEDEATYHKLNELHCDASQGQFIQAPLKLAHNCLKNECDNVVNTLKSPTDLNNHGT
ncbi:bifunctional diguanylate cyclase/phosphodiesterase [Pseudoalteromonas tunicata]|uniref:bifunctional diguanylate cyclase/phosphodiesterase n=1 Tax=Pseudoalteromonas tunicata TaxID=314281 RepID=UPI00273F5FE8|nr:EAL domain-containing protein [Pseudoalteromonas tunicata]MDP4983637.1 EAL domain-containing protein [Pseudoalteromonas tunicata]